MDTPIKKKRIKTRVKGNKNRLIVIEEYESNNYKIGIIERTGIWVFPKDLFGLFDLMAVKNNEWVLIQVASNKPHPHQELSYFAITHADDLHRVKQYVIVNRKKSEPKHMKIFEYFNTGHYSEEKKVINDDEQ